MAEQNTAASPAPAAAPADAAKPAPEPSAPAGFNRQESLSEDDAIIADLRKEWQSKQMEGDEEAPPEPEKKPAAKDKKAPKDKEPAKKEPASSEPKKYETAEAAISDITSALEKWDVDALAAATGKPKSFFEVSAQKWADFREQKSAVREREKQVTTREHTLNQRFAEAKKEVGPALLAAKAYSEGKYDKFVELVNELIKDSGDTYDEAQRKVIKGEIALDPEIKKLRAELKAAREEAKAEKAKETEAAKKGDQKAQFERAVEAVRTELAAHPAAKVKGFETVVLAKVRDSWDGETYTMSFEEAGDEIIEERRAEAEALGYSRPAAATPPKKQDAPTVPPRHRAADAREPDGEEWMKRDMTDEEIIASIKRDVRAGRIKVT